VPHPATTLVPVIPPRPGLDLIVLGAAHAGSPIQWGDVPTWLTAVVAAVALVAAVQAYSKQAESVKHQAEQLRLQGVALVDQQEANRKQAEVVKAQLREMAERAEAYERQQADAITVTATRWTGILYGLRDTNNDPYLHMAVVGNEWHRPIRNVACRIQQTRKGVMNVAVRSGKLIEVPPTLEERATFKAIHGREPEPSDQLVEDTENGQVPFVRAGERAAFIFKSEVGKHPGARITGRFTDDAGLHWQIDPDLSLTKLDSRNW
jgi:hypothetical protein